MVGEGWLVVASACGHVWVYLNTLVVGELGLKRFVKEKGKWWVRAWRNGLVGSVDGQGLV